MASRYLLIEFDSEESANKLRQQIDAAARGGKPFRVVGLFAKPTRYCECDPAKQVTTKAQETTLKRGKKFGWWVCTNCKRPTSAIGSLVNLLKPRDIIDPPSWGNDWTHYIPTLSGLAMMEPGRTFWNER